jgi:tetratricopeptide (TPR) repeat protein
MKQFSLIVKNLTKHPYFSIFGSISSILLLVGNLSLAIKATLLSPFNISLLCILVFFFVRGLFINILSKQEQSIKLIKFAKVGVWGVIILLFVPIYYLGLFFIGKIQTKQSCETNRTKIGLIIANFSKSKDEDDGFSSTLFGKLNSKLQDVDTINLKRQDRYISESSENYLDTIKKVFENNCSQSGLLVFGNRKDDKLFNCRIYSLNYLNFNKQSFKTRDKMIIYLQNPNILNFSIENEAAIISEFIYGLLYYHKGDYKLSSSSLKSALKQNKNPSNIQFISICHLFMGNSESAQGQYSKAIDEYKSGISSDFANSYLHYNLATMFNELGKISEAYKEYEIAQKLNHNLKNPLMNLIINLKDKNSILFSLPTYNFLKHGRNRSIDTSKKVEKNWYERCFIISKNNRFGVVNNEGDTLASCIYDDIEYNFYNNSDCFVLISEKRYGSVIHKHRTDGYILHKLPLEYSKHTIYKAMEVCVDNHLGIVKAEFYPKH